MEKKVYNVHVHYDVCFSYEVVAEDEDEAMEIAESKAETEDSSEGDWDRVESCITSEREVNEETDKDLLDEYNGEEE